MTFNLSFHENFSFETNSESVNNLAAYSEGASPVNASEFHLCAEKLRLPTFNDYLPRPRLNDLLAKSLNQIGATLITGRAGTGKTALAADFAKNYDRVAWFCVEATDTDWKTFSRYMTASFNEPRLDSAELGEETEQFIENLFTRLAVLNNAEPCLLVFDDIHHVFDTEWFPGFFKTLLYSLTPETHLILLSRSNPAFPLWRLRSKQVLGTIDEKLLAFNESETKELLLKYGVSDEKVRATQKKSFGRVSKIRQIANLST